MSLSGADRRVRRRSTTGYLARVIKLSRLLGHLLAGLYIASFRYPQQSDAVRRRTMRKWSRQLLAILAVRLRTRSPRRLPIHCLIVSNHISWLDIFVISAHYPAVFVAKSEIRNWPLIGALCARAGTVFLERGRRTSAKQANSKLMEILGSGIPVSIFPEGSTTDGREIATFHKALFQPAVDAGVQLQPVLLQYQDSTGHYSSAPNYVGETSLLESIWSLVSVNSLVAELSMLPPIPASGHDRQSLSRLAHESIRHALQQRLDWAPEKSRRLPGALQ